MFISLWRGIQRVGLSKTPRNLNVMDMFIIWTVVVVSHWCIHMTKLIKLLLYFMSYSLFHVNYTIMLLSKK